MELQKGYNYLRLSGGDLGDKMVYVGAPNVGLTHIIGQFKRHNLEVVQLDDDTVKNMDAAEFDMLPIPDPYIPPVPFVPPLVNDPWVNTKVVYYEDENCLRCANRYRRSEWCDRHHRQTTNCYRFKLEK